MTIEKLEGESPDAYVIRNYNAYKDDVPGLVQALRENFGNKSDPELTNGLQYWAAFAVSGLNYCRNHNIE